MALYGLWTKSIYRFHDSGSIWPSALPPGSYAPAGSADMFCEPVQDVFLHPYDSLVGLTVTGPPLLPPFYPQRWYMTNKPCGGIHPPDQND